MIYCLDKTIHQKPMNKHVHQPEVLTTEDCIGSTVYRSFAPAGWSLRTMPIAGAEKAQDATASLGPVEGSSGVTGASEAPLPPLLEIESQRESPKAPLASDGIFEWKAEAFARDGAKRNDPSVGSPKMHKSCQLLILKDLA